MNSQDSPSDSPHEIPETQELEQFLFVQLDESSPSGMDVQTPPPLQSSGLETAFPLYLNPSEVPTETGFHPRLRRFDEAA